MHLGIIIPLKSKQVSRDWQITGEALQKTLRSLLNQSIGHFTVVVCGHEKPSFLDQYEFSNVHYVTADFSAPSLSSPAFTHSHYVLDKNRKIVLGLKEFQSKDIQYWYQLDSDDLVHTDFVASLQDLKAESGALIEGGFMYYPKHHRILQTDEMTMWCGSTSIIASDLLNLPETVDFETIKSCPWASWAHMNMRQYFSGIADRKCKTITDPMVVYVRGSGDNISDRYRDNFLKRTKFWLKPYLRGSRIDRRFKRDFTFSE